LAVTAIPAGFHTVTPHLIVTGAAALLEFIERGIGATARHVMRGLDGGIAHGDVLIGDSHVMFGRAPDASKAMPSMLYVYVADCDALYCRAISATRA
jgi:uncharacterized glyoxalase superfamily protein PhnB